LRDPSSHASAAYMGRQEKNRRFIFEPNITVQIALGALTKRFQLFGTVLPYDYFEVIGHKHDAVNVLQTLIVVGRR